MLILKNEQGIALVAAIVVTLIVSLVAVAIASTAVSNRHLSSSSYDVTSSYLNAQTGLDIGKLILTYPTSSELGEHTVEFDKKGDSSAYVQKTAARCDNDVSRSDIDAGTANDCFWWLGDVLNNENYNKENFLAKVASSYFGYDNAQSRYKVELRPDQKPNAKDPTSNIGRAFYRVTSIGKGNGVGLTKLQAQIAVMTKLDTNAVIDLPRSGGAGGGGAGGGIGSQWGELDSDIHDES